MCFWSSYWILAITSSNNSSIKLNSIQEHSPNRKEEKLGFENGICTYINSICLFCCNTLKVLLTYYTSDFDIGKSENSYFYFNERIFAEKNFAYMEKKSGSLAIDISWTWKEFISSWFVWLRLMNKVHKFQIIIIHTIRVMRSWYYL